MTQSPEQDLPRQARVEALRVLANERAKKQKPLTPDYPVDEQVRMTPARRRAVKEQAAQALASSRPPRPKHVPHVVPVPVVVPSVTMPPAVPGIPLSPAMVPTDVEVVDKAKVAPPIEVPPTRERKVPMYRRLTREERQKLGADADRYEIALAEALKNGAITGPP